MRMEPIFFEKNRVWRVYTGGKLFEGLWEEKAVDSFYPEEWIASSVRALNRNSNSENEGLSKLENSDQYFDEVLKNDPESMFFPRQ